MNQVLKYTPKIQFIGKRSAATLVSKVASPVVKSNYIHKIVDYGRRVISVEEIDIINQGGVADMKWKSVKQLKA